MASKKDCYIFKLEIGDRVIDLDEGIRRPSSLTFLHNGHAVILAYFDPDLLRDRRLADVTPIHRDLLPTSIYTTLVASVRWVHLHCRQLAD